VGKKRYIHRTKPVPITHPKVASVISTKKNRNRKTKKRTQPLKPLGKKARILKSGEEPHGETFVQANIRP